MKAFTDEASQNAVKALAVALKKAKKQLNLKPNERNALVRAVLKTIAPKNGGKQ
jgi:hypothetical protein